MGTEEYTYFLKHEEYAQLIDLKLAAEFLGYGSSVPEGEVKKTLAQCAGELTELLCPAMRLYVTAWKDSPDGELEIVFPDGGLRLAGEAIRAHLAKSSRVLCVCVTLGSRVDAWIGQLGEKSMLESLLADALANAAAERLREYAERKAAERWPGFSVGWTFGIGYGDLPLTLQREFLSKMHAEQEIGLTCNEKQVLLPLKSVTGFSAMTEKGTGLPAENGEWRVKGCGKRRCEDCPMREKCRESHM